jgi:hypothetical protein
MRADDRVHLDRANFVSGGLARRPRGNLKVVGRRRFCRAWRVMTRSPPTRSFTSSASPRSGRLSSLRLTDPTDKERIEPANTSDRRRHGLESRGHLFRDLLV